MTSLLTWKPGQYNTHTGSAADLRLFSVTWKSRREDPNWLMRSDLPGFEGREWKNDDLAELQGLASAVLAAWLSKITGLFTDRDEFAARDAAYAEVAEGSTLPGELQMAVSEGFAAGWLARAKRGKGETS